MQNDECRHLRKQEGEQRARTLLNREMNPSEISNREMRGLTQLSETQDANLQLVSSITKCQYQREKMSRLTGH